MVYGVTPTGFNRKPESVIVDDIERRQLAEISSALDLSTTSLLGQVNGIIGREIGIAWEQLEVCYHGFDPDRAEGALLDSLSKLTGTRRRGAGYSLVLCMCDLNAGTVLQSGVHFASVEGNPTSLWTPNEDYTAEESGEQEVLFRAENPGPIPANNGSITVIQTSVVGWNSVTNALDADPGFPTDTDPTLRLRRRQQLGTTGSARTDAIAAAVAKVTGVQDVEVIENVTNAEDEFGLPPHSFEVIVFDGIVPPDDNDAIAQAIWDTKAGGIRAFGDLEGTAKDFKGRDRVMNFTRVEVVELYCTITVSTPDMTKYIGDEALKAYIAAQANALVGVGIKAKIRQLDSIAFGAGGVDNVTDFRMGDAPAPTGTADYAVTIRQVVNFDTSRITVVHV